MSEDAIEFTYTHTSHRSIVVAGTDLDSLAKATGMTKTSLLILAEDGELLDDLTEDDETRVEIIRRWLEENENRLGDTTDEEEFQDLKAY